MLINNEVCSTVCCLGQLGSLEASELTPEKHLKIYLKYSIHSPLVMLSLQFNKDGEALCVGDTNLH